MEDWIGYGHGSWSFSGKWSLEKKVENTDITEENKKRLEEIGLFYVSKEESKTNNIVFTDADNNLNNTYIK